MPTPRRARVGRGGLRAAARPRGRQSRGHRGRDRSTLVARILDAAREVRRGIEPLGRSPLEPARADVARPTRRLVGPGLVAATGARPPRRTSSATCTPPPVASSACPMRRRSTATGCAAIHELERAYRERLAACPGAAGSARGPVAARGAARLATSPRRSERRARSPPSESAARSRRPRLPARAPPEASAPVVLRRVTDHEAHSLELPGGGVVAVAPPDGPGEGGVLVVRGTSRRTHMPWRTAHRATTTPPTVCPEPE